MIKFEEVEVSFKQKDEVVTAVKDVSFEIKKGEIFGVVGGSGAGKSTLVRTINGLQKPTNGKIIVDGQDVTSLDKKGIRELRKNIGMIFQHFNLISRKTVGKNVEFALKVQDYPKAKRAQRVKELLTLVGLEDKENVYPSSLSGGQKQRVAIARTLAADPKILLCDEATSALDVQTTEEIVDILRDINAKLGITIVFITHQIEVAKKLFDRIAVMKQGEIIELNETYEIFASPQEELTKKLVTSEQKIPESILHEVKGDILKLTYKGTRSVQPVIATVNKKYDVVVNILQGNIEYVQHKPIGTLFVSLEGDVKEKSEAISYLVTHIEKVESLSEEEREAV